MHPDSCRGNLSHREGLDVADILEIIEGRLTVLVNIFLHALTNDLYVFLSYYTTKVNPINCNDV